MAGSTAVSLALLLLPSAVALSGEPADAVPLFPAPAALASSTPSTAAGGQPAWPRVLHTDTDGDGIYDMDEAGASTCDAAAWVQRRECAGGQSDGAEGVLTLSATSGEFDHNPSRPGAGARVAGA